MTNFDYFKEILNRIGAYSIFIGYVGSENNAAKEC